MAEDYEFKVIKAMIARYSDKLIDADASERFFYSMFIESLKEMIYDLAHRE